jgi:uncharacterized protein DUF2530
VPRPTKPAPPPLQVDTTRVVLTGIALWAVALVVLLLLGDRVDRLWTWTCVTAIGLAVLGLGVMRLQGQLGRRAAGQTAPDQSSRTSNSDVS